MPTKGLKKKLTLDFKNIQFQPPKPPEGIDSEAQMVFDGKQYKVEARKLTTIEELGHGAFGYVERLRHPESGFELAVKRITVSVSEKERKCLQMDLDVNRNAKDCPHIVKFYGALYCEGDLWICMEIMDSSLDKFYKGVYERKEFIPEGALCKILESVVAALQFLHERLKVIHRDIKPSNILVNRRGEIKMCDFGVSGNLINSIAKTRDAGCSSYMAPERIDPDRLELGYDIRSDVWSLGITMMELALGRLPMGRIGLDLKDLQRVVFGDSPTYSDLTRPLSDDFKDFTRLCLLKNFKERPKYAELKKHPLFVKSVESDFDVAAYFAANLPEPDKATVATADAAIEAGTD